MAAATRKSTAEASPEGMHPRTARAREELLTASIGIIARHGYDGLTMDRVAAEARSSKQTIYRLWSSKEELVADVFLRYRENTPEPDTGNLRDDLLQLVRSQVRELSTSDVGRAMAEINVAASHGSDVLKRTAEDARERRRASRLQVVARAVDRGELDADVDADLMIDMVSYTTFLRLAVFQRPVDNEYPERLVERVLAAFGARASQ